MSMEIVKGFSAAILLLGATTALAQSPESLNCGKRRVSEFQGTFENDLLVPFDPSDVEYTNGFRFDWTYYNGCAPLWMGEWGERHLPPVGDRLKSFIYHDNPAAEYHYAIEFGHSIFTPNDIGDSDLIPDDRPYAGFFYGGVSYAVSDNDGPVAARRQHQFQFQIGAVGKVAHAAQIQKAVHFATHSKTPRGWNNQLRNEPGLQANYTYQRRLVFGGDHFDLLPGISAAIGTLYDYAGTQLLLRAGTKNMRGFPISNITLSAADANHRGDGRVEFYVYGGAEARYVLHNIFLDGNTFEDSQNVHKEPLVYDLKAGASLRMFAWRLSYSFVHRSREFSPTPLGANTAGHGFGSATISWERRL